ncbi:MAG: hypothetical protein KJO98_14795 [Rhodothermia bacterium]|nr:hypothetical protein [Rhodothermia bacterium]
MSEMLREKLMGRFARGQVFVTVVLVAFTLLLPRSSDAQFANKWLSAGSLHNWYSEIGGEREEGGFIQEQQSGMRWPGIYNFRDTQAAKGFWIGARNVTDDTGRNWSERVVHVGPRATGADEFFPIRFEMVSRYEPPVVFVDGALSEGTAAMANDRVDPTMIADRMIINEVNTLLGITMERKIYQFSQDYHDSYHILEHTFTNTGNVDGDDEIELPSQTLEDVYFFWQWRWSVAAESRFVIGNATGWGKNAMNDARGDGVLPDPAGEDFRAQFTWHGHFPPFTLYDNIGGPILKPALPALQIEPADTLGRLGASAFVGHVVLHADTSPSDPADDRSQPTTTTWFDSDEPFTSQNSAFNPTSMAVEYNLMSSGHKSPRHAWAVEPSGMQGWLDPSADPSQGKPGGASHAAGFGPYTLAPGESVTIILAEAVNGLSRDEDTRVGRAYQRGELTDLQKNEIVFQSRDSLFMMYRRALANFESGWDIPRPPYPPSQFIVNSGGDRISLEWDVFDDGPSVDRFEIYRALGDFDSTYTLIHTASAADRSFDDTTPIRGIDYFYYIQAVGLPGDNNGNGNTPAGVALRSSRYYTQTYEPARLRRQAGSSFDDRPCPAGEEFRCIVDVETGDLILPGLRIVPNPFHLGADQNLRFPDQTDKLAFFNVPGFCRIEIFTELGELVDVVDHNDGSGDEFWDHTTASRQIVASGVYIAVVTVTQDIEDPATGELQFRQGEKAIRKFIIIR